MYLGSNEVEAVPARDTPADVAQVVKQMQARHAWSHLGPEGRLIQTVLAGVDEADEMGAMAAWESQLRRKLAWPFEAEVAEFQESGPLRAGDRVTVRRIVDVDETYGVLVYVEKPRRGELTFPLADLEVVDQTSPNYPLVEAYVAWFANR